MATDFKVFPIKIRTGSCVRHWFINKLKAESKDRLKPINKTLIIYNVPPYANQESLQIVFSRFGDVDKVCIQDDANFSDQKPSTSYFETKDKNFKSKVAFVVFETPESLKSVLTMDLDKAEPPILFPDKMPATGYAQMCQNYERSIVNRKELRNEFKEFMDEFDDKERREKESLKLKDGQADADGWVTVTKGPKRKLIAAVDANDDKKSKKKKKNTEELPNFYTFQKREAKLKHLEELQKRFEEDKKKVQMMKQARKFKPT